MKTALLVLAAYVFLAPAFLYALYLAENAGSTELARAGRRPGGLAGVLLRGYLSGAACQLAVLLLYLPGYLPWPRPQRTGPPVVLVHGLYHNASAWFVFRRRLSRAGLTNVQAWSYFSFGKDFDALARGLVERILRVLEDNPGQRAVLVGHSLGGLLVRAAQSDVRLRGRIAAVVTLGAPHRGSALARLGVGGLARSLVRDGAVVRGLPSGRGPGDAPGLSVYSAADDFVTPLSALAAPPGWLEVEAPPVSHVAMLYSRPVADEVLGFIARALSDRP
ncbi:MAG: alpha/beta fold hydrolase [Desulfovibrionaceae bacterium]|nr:alpha/beta fold hydrolase [Desulfovibrionaceae bacterium]